MTGAALVEHSGAAYWLAFNIGDSRIYRCADGALTQISVDHSYVQELVDAGELEPAAARHHPRRNVITRAVGVGVQGEPDCWLLPGIEGDRLLLCSDGVTGELTDELLQRILADHLGPQQAADAVVAAAIGAGGRDNATAVVIDVLAVASPRIDRGTTADRGGRRMPAPRTDSEIEQTRPRPRAGSSGRSRTQSSTTHPSSAVPGSPGQPSEPGERSEPRQPSEPSEPSQPSEPSAHPVA